MYYDDYDDSYDIWQLQKLPQFHGLTEKELRHIISKLNQLERQQWEADVIDMLRNQRQKTLAYIEESSKSKGLPREQVQIQTGVRISPQAVDPNGFVSHNDLERQKGTLKLFLDDKRKIYL